MIHTVSIPCCLWRRSRWGLRAFSSLSQLAASAEKRHRFASPPRKYFNLPGNTKQIQSESKNKQWWLLQTTPWNDALLSRNWSGIVHGGVLATPGFSSVTAQLNVFFQKAFKISSDWVIRSILFFCWIPLLDIHHLSHAKNIIKTRNYCHKGTKTITRCKPRHLDVIICFVRKHNCEVKQVLDFLTPMKYFWQIGKVWTYCDIISWRQLGWPGKQDVQPTQL